MENYTIEDIKEFLKSKGYAWKGEIWVAGLSAHKIKDVSELYGRTRPIIQFVLYKDGQAILQNMSVFDTSLKFWQENELSQKNKFVLEKDYSSEWTDFLAARHNANLY